MGNDKQIGRLAGGIYLVVVVTGLFSLMYVPSQITVPGDTQATLANILEHQSLFRAGIAAFLVKQITFLLLPLVLFKLLRQVNTTAATAMVALAVASVPIALASLAHRLDALEILTGAPGLGLSPGQIQSQALLSLAAYRNGLLLTSMFWGLWLLPFGYLVIRSGFLPKLLGVFLVLGGVGYVAQVLTTILAADANFPDAVLFAAAIGEIGICLWLLVVGVRSPRPASS